MLPRRLRQAKLSVRGPMARFFKKLVGGGIFTDASYLRQERIAHNSTSTISIQGSLIGRIIHKRPFQRLTPAYLFPVLLTFLQDFLRFTEIMQFYFSQGLLVSPTLFEWRLSNHYFVVPR